MPEDNPTNAYVFKDPCLKVIFDMFVEYCTKLWPLYLSMYGDRKKAAEALTDRWHGEFSKHPTDPHAVYCRGQRLCKQSVHRLVSGEELYHHLQNCNAAAAHNAQTPPPAVRLGFRRKIFPYTTADELLETRPSSGGGRGARIVEIFYQSTWGSGRDAFKRQTSTGVYVISISPVKHYILPGAVVERLAPPKISKSAGKCGKAVDELSEYCAFSELPEEFLEEHVVYGLLDSVAVAEMYLEAAKEAEAVIKNNEDNIDGYWRAEAKFVKLYYAFGGLKGLIEAIAAIVPPGAPAWAQQQAALKVCLDIMEGGSPGALLLKQPYLFVNIVEVILANTPKDQLPKPGAGALYRSRQAGARVDAATRIALGEAADWADALSGPLPLPASSRFAPIPGNDDALRAASQTLYTVIYGLRVEDTARVLAENGVRLKVGGAGDVAALRVALKGTMPSYEYYFPETSYDHQPDFLRVPDDEDAMRMGGGNIAVGGAHERKRVVREESGLRRDSLPACKICTQLGGINGISVFGTGANEGKVAVINAQKVAAIRTKMHNFLDVTFDMAVDEGSGALPLGGDGAIPPEQAAAARGALFSPPKAAYTAAKFGLAFDTATNLAGISEICDAGADRMAAWRYKVCAGVYASTLQRSVVARGRDVEALARYDEAVALVKDAVSDVDAMAKQAQSMRINDLRKLFEYANEPSYWLEAPEGSAPLGGASGGGGGGSSAWVRVDYTGAGFRQEGNPVIVHPDIAAAFSSSGDALGVLIINLPAAGGDEEEEAGKGAGTRRTTRAAAAAGNKRRRDSSPPPARAPSPLLYDVVQPYTSSSGAEGCLISRPLACGTVIGDFWKGDRIAKPVTTPAELYAQLTKYGYEDENAQETAKMLDAVLIPTDGGDELRIACALLIARPCDVSVEERPLECRRKPALAVLSEPDAASTEKTYTLGDLSAFTKDQLLNLCSRLRIPRRSRRRDDLVQYLLEYYEERGREGGLCGEDDDADK